MRNPTKTQKRTLQPPIIRRRS